MNFLQKLFSKNPKIEDQAVLLYLDVKTLSKEIYEKYDLMTLEEKIIEVIKGRGLGEYDGNEIGSGETVIFLYGPDAEKLFAAIEPIIRSYPLCKNARVLIRQGGPGAKQREVRI
jgi:hypothetical protein